MSTPNGRKFSMHTVAPNRAINNSIANEVSNVFYRNPFLVPINTSTGSIDSIYFKNATGSTLYLNTLTGPVLSQLNINVTGSGLIGPTGPTGTFNPGDNITATNIYFSNATGSTLYLNTLTGPVLSKIKLQKLKMKMLN